MTLNQIFVGPRMNLEKHVTSFEFQLLTPDRKTISFQSGVSQTQKLYDGNKFLKYTFTTWDLCRRRKRKQTEHGVS